MVHAYAPEVRQHMVIPLIWRGKRHHGGLHGAYRHGQYRRMGNASGTCMGGVHGVAHGRHTCRRVRIEEGRAPATHFAEHAQQGMMQSKHARIG